MLTVYSSEFEKGEDFNKWFEKSIKAFDFTNPCPVANQSGYVYIEKNIFESPFGRITVEELPDLERLAYCLLQFPDVLFECKLQFIHEKEKILLSEEGSLVMLADTAFPYTFPVKCYMHGIGEIRLSTDLAYALQRTMK